MHTKLYMRCGCASYVVCVTHSIFALCIVQFHLPPASASQKRLLCHLMSPHLYNVQYAMYNVLLSTSFCNIQYTMHNIRCIMSISQSLQYTIYNVQYMIYTIYNVYVSISQSLRCTIDFMVIHKTQCINLLAY